MRIAIISSIAIILSAGLIIAGIKLSYDRGFKTANEENEVTVATVRNDLNSSRSLYRNLSNSNVSLEDYNALAQDYDDLIAKYNRLVDDTNTALDKIQLLLAAMPSFSNTATSYFPSSVKLKTNCTTNSIGATTYTNCN